MISRADATVRGAETRIRRQSLRNATCDWFLVAEIEAWAGSASGVQMAGATTGGPNKSLIDDPTFITYLDDLDRGLRTNNRASDEEELPLDASPASPDDPNFRSNLEALDRGLSDKGVIYPRAASPADG